MPKKIKNVVEYRSLAELSKLKNNPRKIDKSEMNSLVESIKKNDDYFEARPLILSDRTGEIVIIAGNQRYEAAKIAGLTEVPTVLLHPKTEEDEAEIVFRDNHNNGSWDNDLMKSSWSQYEDKMGDWLGNDYEEAWGKPQKEIIEDKIEPLDGSEPVSIVGGIYQLGEHRVFCGSFEDLDGVKSLFGDQKAVCTFTDPPYNVAVKNRSTGKKIQNDNMKEDEFQDFLNRAFECVAKNMAPGGGCN